MTVSESGQGRHLGNETDHLQSAIHRIRNVGCIGIKGGQGADRAQEYSHGMGIMVKLVHEVLDVLVNHGMNNDFLAPFFVFLFSRKFTVQEEKGNL